MRHAQEVMFTLDSPRRRQAMSAGATVPSVEGRVPRGARLMALAIRLDGLIRIGSNSRLCGSRTAWQGDACARDPDHEVDRLGAGYPRDDSISPAQHAVEGKKSAAHHGHDLLARATAAISGTDAHQGP